MTEVRKVTAEDSVRAINRALARAKTVIHITAGQRRAILAGTASKRSQSGR